MHSAEWLNSIIGHHVQIVLVFQFSAIVGQLQACSSMQHFVQTYELAVINNIFLWISFTISSQINLQHNNNLYNFYSYTIQQHLKQFSELIAVYKHTAVSPLNLLVHQRASMGNRGCGHEAGGEAAHHGQEAGAPPADAGGRRRPQGGAPAPHPAGGRQRQAGVRAQHLPVFAEMKLLRRCGCGRWRRSAGCCRWPRSPTSR